MLPNWYKDYKNLIEKSIDNYLSEYFWQEKHSDKLNSFKEAVFYAIKWWKKIRSILALEFYIIFSNKTINEIKKDDDILKYCLALEFLHIYSLIHDDLPCMDNDEYRRWKLTVWKKYSESTAVLVWDFFNSLSFEILSNINSNLKQILSYFGKSVWFFWMLGWQVLDLYFEKNLQNLNISSLIETHNKKTWWLIRVSIIWWILISWKDIKLNKYEKFWQKIWLAFQIKDDLIDVEWTFEETGKSVWWEKKWFIHFLWKQKSKECLDRLISECFTIVEPLKSEKIEFLIEYIKTRVK